MSEYQYYEFLAVDQPLDEQQMVELRALSTRADITATSFVNEYHWGNFRGDPVRLMERYFDAFLYLANWGTHQLMFRLPERLLDLDTAQQYCVGDAASAWRSGGQLVVCLHSEDEESDWDGTDETRLGALIPVRADLAAGDHRALYLAWLLCAQTELDEDEPEPPVPPGLATLTGPLRALAGFLRVDEDLLAVAAEASERAAAQLPDAELGALVAGLPAKDKDALLVRVVKGDPHVAAELRRCFRLKRTDTPPTGTRTVGDLLASATERRTAREREAARRAAAERARREQEAAAAREERLDALAADRESVWRKVDALINTKRPAEYDNAVGLLTDLRAVHARTGELPAFSARCERLRDEHGRKPSLLQRLDRAGL